MNGDSAFAIHLVSEIAKGIHENPDLKTHNDFLVCPPFPYLREMLSSVKDTGIDVGGQDCSEHEQGAYTGEVAAPMLSDIGCSHVILGHSERRQYHGEGNDLVMRKAASAQAHNLTAIICIGETDEQRQAGNHESIVAEQLLQSLPDDANSDNTVIAYEPVWAIGTGKTATPDDVQMMHAFIREKLKEKLADFDKVRILYGGSVKPDNAQSLFTVPNVNGALIGGASLKANDYLSIASA